MLQQFHYSNQLTFFQKIRSFDFTLLFCILIIGIIFYLVDFYLNKSSRNFFIYLVFINLIFIYSVFLFNEETLEYILKGKMNNLLFMSSGIFAISIVKIFNNKLIKKLNI